MRDKILKLLNLIGLDDMVNYASTDIFERFHALMDTLTEGGTIPLPPTTIGMITKFEEATKTERGTLEQRLVDECMTACADLGFTEEEIDGFITFIENPVNKRLVEFGSRLQTVSGPIRNEWENELLQKNLSNDLMQSLGYNLPEEIHTTPEELAKARAANLAKSDEPATTEPVEISPAQ